MLENKNECPSENCGCQIDTFPTTQECPNCGKRLRLIGQSQLLKFRLACPNCGIKAPYYPGKSFKYYCK